MSKFLAIFCGFLATATLRGAYSADSNIVATVEKYMWYPIKLDVTSMTDAERAQFIAEFRKHVNSTSFRYRYGARTALLTLGDEETMAELVKEARSEDKARSAEAMGILRESRNPAVIPFLAELLYLPEEANEGFEGEFYVTSRPLTAARTIQTILARDCKEVAPETRQWLQYLREKAAGEYKEEQRRMSYEAFRGAIRALWEENREAFLRKDYAAVKPPKAVRLPEPATATNRSEAAATPAASNAVLRLHPSATNAVAQSPAMSAVPVPKPEPAAAAPSSSAPTESPSRSWPTSQPGR